MYRGLTDVVIKLYRELWSLEEEGWLLRFRVGYGEGGADRGFQT